MLNEKSSPFPPFPPVQNPIGQSGSDPEITALRAEVESLETKLALYRRREQLDREYYEITERDKCADIIQAVCREFAIPATLIFRRDRSEEVVTPRMIAMAIAYESTKLTLHKIGSIFQKDHSTVLHASRTIRDRIATDPAFAARVARIRSALSSMPDAKCSMLNAQ